MKKTLPLEKNLSGLFLLLEKNQEAAMKLKQIWACSKLPPEIKDYHHEKS